MTIRRKFRILSHARAKRIIGDTSEDVFPMSRVPRQTLAALRKSLKVVKSGHVPTAHAVAQCAKSAPVSAARAVCDVHVAVSGDSKDPRSMPQPADHRKRPFREGSCRRGPYYSPLLALVAWDVPVADMDAPECAPLAAA